MVVGVVGALLGVGVGFIPGVAITYPLTGSSGSYCVIEGSGSRSSGTAAVSHFLDVPWALILGLVGFAAASMVGALVTSTGALIAARVGMGFFAALIFPTTLSIISNTFTERREPEIFPTTGTATSLGCTRSSSATPSRW